MTNRRSFLAKSAAGFAGAVTAASSLGVAQAAAPLTGLAASALTDTPLAGKAAVVTGARANIGRAIAAELARLGADVVVHHHTPDTRDQAEETARLVRTHGRRAEIVVGDLGDRANVVRMFDTAERAFGRLDVFVHNAGALVKGPLAALSDADYVRMQRVNVDATFYGFREAARRIQDGGRIVGVSSSVTGGPPPQYGVYTGGKMFMNGLVFALAKELGARGITVNAIAPGPIDTPFFHSQETPESVAYIRRLAPLGRLGEVEELIPVVRLLVAPDAVWLNGETLYVNNGYLQA